MHKIFLFFILFIPLVGAVGVSPTSIDFGVVKRGEIEEFSFTVFNELNKEMEYSLEGDYLKLPLNLKLKPLSSIKINSSLKIPKEFYLNNYSGIILIKEINENKKIKLINSVGIKYSFNVSNPLKKLKEENFKENDTQIKITPSLEFINISNIDYKKPVKISGAFYNYGIEKLNSNMECEIYFENEIIDFVRSSSLEVLKDEGVLFNVYFTPLKYGDYLSKCRVNYNKKHTSFIEKEFSIEKRNLITGNFFLTPERSIFSGLFGIVIVLGIIFVLRYFIGKKQDL